jgi:hypothetical protein
MFAIIGRLILAQAWRISSSLSSASMKTISAPASA